ncbi:MAG TPA: hypothetical protein VFP84_12995 [Kofleriaceae bacterium]|nr:hypothetical protein [Kofleriaceae bacterium]
MPTLVESFELLVLAEQLAPRLAAAEAALAQLPGLEGEKAWLAAARDRLATARPDAHGALLDRALRLPELDGLKDERGKLLQGAIADEIERLQAGIAFAGGARSPLLDALFQGFKLAALRKAPRPQLEKFCLEIERRLASSYARRMLASETYAALAPTLAAVEAAIATWRSVFVDPPLDGAPAEALRAELTGAGAHAELAIRQARLLAQAALLPAAELLDAAGVLTAKARRRDDAHPMLEHDPPPPGQPTAHEQAELAALHASSLA